MGIKQIQMDCEIVTTTFISGADGMTPELRAPSIKGLVRYWWRAANAHMDVATILDKEKDIFGGTGKRLNDNKQEYGKSKIGIRIAQDISDINISNSLYGDEINYIPKRGRSGKEYKIPLKYEGICYMLYSTLLPNRERGYIKPGSSFSIVLSFNDKFKDELNEFLRGFLYLEYFGGIGSRSRRGAGSLRVVDVDNLDYIEDDIKNEIYMNNINTVNELAERFRKISRSLKKPISSEYSILKGSRIYIFNRKGTWKDALESTSKNFRDFRWTRKSDIYDTPNFGIPISHRNKTVMVGINYKEEEIRRRSSPLIFKVLKTGEKNYFPIIIHLNGKFLPEGYNISKLKGTYNIENIPSDKIIDEFLGTFGKTICERVIL